ncbi:matrixin family metalloprotease [Microbacterium suwonense]|uniref:matrixin family metalloprotease n=2 Tax=Microbacterium suwonense TaxID=683047 RepID=UPI00360D007A
MTIPEPGYTVVRSALGSEIGEEIAVYSSPNGGVAASVNDVMMGEPGAVAELIEQTEASGSIVGTNAPTNSKCSATAPGSISYTWNNVNSFKKMAWRWNGSGAPSGAFDRVKAGADTVEQGRSTTCGNLSNGFDLIYEGTTTQTASVNSSGGCTNLSYQSTISFGDITNSANNWLAMTCTYLLLGTLVEADIKFDTSSRVWNTNSSSCSAGYDLQGVATHEFGHAVGMNHVAQNSGQVMAPSTGTCNLSQRQLGRGDQNILRSKYGS